MKDTLRQYITPQPGNELRKLFYPNSARIAASMDQVGKIAEAVRVRLQETRGQEVENRKGYFGFVGEAAQVMQKAGIVVTTLLSNPQSIRLPDTQSERKAFGNLLVDSLLNCGGKTMLIAPVCPDYAQDRSSVGGGISAEAKAGVLGMETVITAFKNGGYDPRGIILVADTEDDIQEVINKSSSGNGNFYKSQCLSSVRAISEELKSVDGVEVGTFSSYLGDDFRKKQYSYEEIIRELMNKDRSFLRRIEGVGATRRTRHSDILGREEKDYELTVRYAAQYAALGNLLRDIQVPTAALNYATPNRLYFNPQQVHPDLPQKGEAIPVLGTLIQRQL